MSTVLFIISLSSSFVVCCFKCLSSLNQDGFWLVVSVFIIQQYRSSVALSLDSLFFKTVSYLYGYIRRRWCEWAFRLESFTMRVCVCVCVCVLPLSSDWVSVFLWPVSFLLCDAGHSERRWDHAGRTRHWHPICLSFHHAAHCFSHFLFKEEVIHSCNPASTDTPAKAIVVTNWQRWEGYFGNVKGLHCLKCKSRVIISITLITF